MADAGSLHTFVSFPLELSLNNLAVWLSASSPAYEYWWPESSSMAHSSDLAGSRARPTPRKPLALAASSTLSIAGDPNGCSDSPKYATRVFRVALSAVIVTARSVGCWLSACSSNLSRRRVVSVAMPFGSQ